MPPTGTTAPVCLFVYKRLDTLQACVESLLRNDLASLTDLYVFSDAAKSREEGPPVNEVRKFISSISGFRSVRLSLRPVNMGLAASIIEGVSSVLDRIGKVIVLEDDLVVSTNFLDFMNAALDFYRDNPSVFSVAGFSSPITGHHASDVYFTLRASSWGWATWKNRWETIDWSVSDYDVFQQDGQARERFNRMGSDLSRMLEKQMTGLINSWAIRWTFHQFRNGLYSVFPFDSKVMNNGFGGRATHTSKVHRDRFSTHLDNSSKKAFRFPSAPFLDTAIIRDFTRPYSKRTRVLYKLKAWLSLY